MVKAKKKGNASDQDLEYNAQGNVRKRAHLCPVSGLTNLGNTCYFNSAVQLLAACPPLVQSLLQSPGAASNAQQLPSIGKGPLGFALQQAITHMHGKFGGLCSPRKQPNAYNPQALHAALVRVAPQFKGWQQHDSQEALHALLDALQEEAAKLHALLHGPPARRASQEQPSSEITAKSSIKSVTADDSPSVAASSSSPASAQSSCTQHQDASHASSCMQQQAEIGSESTGLFSSTHADEAHAMTENVQWVSDEGNDVQKDFSNVLCGVVVSGNKDANSHVKPVVNVSDSSSSTTTVITSTSSSNTLKDQAVDQQPGSRHTVATSPPEVVSLIGSLFKGQLKSTVTCQACQHKSSSHESFLEMSLPIPTPAELKQLRAGIRLSPIDALPPAHSTAAAEEEMGHKSSSKTVKAGKAGKSEKVKGKKGKAGQAAGAAEGSSTEATEDAAKHESAANKKDTIVTAVASEVPSGVKPAKESAKERRRREAEEKHAAIEAKRNAKKMQMAQQHAGWEPQLVVGPEPLPEQIPEQLPATDEHTPVAAASENHPGSGVTSISNDPPMYVQHNRNSQDTDGEAQVSSSTQVHNEITTTSKQDSGASSSLQSTVDGSTVDSSRQIDRPADNIMICSVSQGEHARDYSSSSYKNGSGHVCITGFDINPNSCNNGSNSVTGSNELSSHSNGFNGSSGSDSRPEHLNRPAVTMSHSALSNLFKSHPLSHHGSMSEISDCNGAQSVQGSVLENISLQDTETVPVTQSNGVQPAEVQPNNSTASDQHGLANAPTIPTQPAAAVPGTMDTLAAAYRSHNVSGAGLHLLDCLGLFFSAEQITWECPKEKSEARDTFARLSHVIRSASLSPAAEGISAENLTDVSEAVQLLQRLTSGEMLLPIVNRPQQSNGTSSSPMQAATIAATLTNIHEQDTSAADSQSVVSKPAAAVVIGSETPVQASPFQHEDVQQPSPVLAAITCPSEAPARADWFGHSPLSPLINMLSQSPELSANQTAPLNSLASLTHMSTSKTPLSNTISQLVKKQVRFSCLPPAVKHIPGGHRQKGHELQAALRGDVPFSRPACTPAPANLQDMTSSNSAAKQDHKKLAKDTDTKVTKKERSKVVEAVATGNDDDLHEQDAITSKKSWKKGSKHDKKSGKKLPQTEALEGPSRFLKQLDTAADEEVSEKYKKKNKSGSRTSKQDKAMEQHNAVDCTDRDERHTTKASKKSGKQGSAGKKREGHSRAEVTPLKRAITKSNDKAETDQWLEGESMYGLANKQMIIKGLMIQAQLVKPTLTQLCVKLTPGPELSPGLVAVLFEPYGSPQGGGIQLCTADIKAAWQPAASKSDMPVTRKKTRQQLVPATQQLPGSNDGGDIRVDSSSNSEEGCETQASDWETDSGEGSDGDDVMTSLDDTSISTQAACTVCDAVQVMMDYAAYLVLTKGIQGAIQVLSNSQPCIIHDAGTWRVQGIDSHTKQSWTFPPHVQLPHPCTTTTASCQELVVNSSNTLRPVSGLLPDGTLAAENGSGRHTKDALSHIQPSSEQQAYEQPLVTSKTQDADVCSPCNTVVEYDEGQQDSSCDSNERQFRLLGGRQESFETDDSEEIHTAPKALTSHNVIKTTSDGMQSVTSQSAPVPCKDSYHNNGHHGSSSGLNPSDKQQPLTCCSPPVIGSTTPPGSSRLKKPSSSVFQRQALKNYTLQVLPRVLLIHLKRFHHAKGSAFGKLNMHIAFPDMLDVSHLLCDYHLNPQLTPRQDDEQNSSDKAVDPSTVSVTSIGVEDIHKQREGGTQDVKQCCNSKYKLAGLIEHQGGSMRCGHYVAYVCHHNDSDRPEKMKQESHIAAPTSHSIDASDGVSNGSMEEVEASENNSTAETSNAAVTQAPACVENGTQAAEWQWYCISDTTVTPVSHAKVMAAQAYVLMYLQV